MSLLTDAEGREDAVKKVVGVGTAEDVPEGFSCGAELLGRRNVTKVALAEGGNRFVEGLVCGGEQCKLAFVGEGGVGGFALAEFEGVTQGLANGFTRVLGFATNRDREASRRSRREVGLGVDDDCALGRRVVIAFCGEVEHDIRLF